MKRLAVNRLAVKRETVRRLELNPTGCAAHGLCAELLPERIVLDEWGYPILDATPVADDLVKAARRAVAACPTLALRIASLDRLDVR